MKFLHLSTGDVRGAFTGAYRLHENLKSAGHESKMFVRMKDSNDPDVLAPSKITQIRSRISAKLFNSLYMRIFGNLTEFNKRYFFPYKGVVDLNSLYSTVTFKPDLIIVYYVANFLSASDLQAIKKHYDAPMAFYLMDAGMLTGGCHYPWDCEGFLNKCGNCPVFRKPNDNDLSNIIWVNRNSVFHRMKYSIIAGSSWLNRLTEKCSLHATRRINKILMGLDSDVYKLRDKMLSRKELGIPCNSGDIIIYFGAQQLDDPRKGFTYLYSALELLQSRISNDLMDNLILLTVGAQQPSSINNLQFRHHHVVYLHDKQTFAKTYNAADFFICPSVEDAGPMMINEAIMSGTPVIAFRMGVAEDLIIEDETGYIAENFNSEDLADKIHKIITLDTERRNEMSLNCRKLALNLISQQVQVQQIMMLTEELNTEYMDNTNENIF